MANIYSDVSSQTARTRAMKEIIRALEDLRDQTGSVHGSIGYLDKRLDELSATISGLSRTIQGLQRLGLHVMTVSIDAPVSGSIISNTITISGTWTDQSGHSMISGRLLVSGVLVTTCTFPASGYFNATLDSTKFGNEWIPVQVEITCAVGTSKRSNPTYYRIYNQIAAGGTSQHGEAKQYGDKVDLTLSSPGQVAYGSFEVKGTFSSAQGHAIASVQAWSNTSKLSVGTPTWQGYGITIPCYVGEWGGVQFGIVTCRVIDSALCQVEASTKVYNPLPKLPGV